jgi:hypothetical protein
LKNQKNTLHLFSAYLISNLSAQTCGGKHSLRLGVLGQNFSWTCSQQNGTPSGLSNSKVAGLKNALNISAGIFQILRNKKMIFQKVFFV